MTTNTKTVAFVNLKGGVGKTTSAIGTAEALARLGHTVTARDADPSGAATLVGAQGPIGRPPTALRGGGRQPVHRRRARRGGIMEINKPMATRNMLASTLTDYRKPVKLLKMRGDGAPALRHTQGERRAHVRRGEGGIMTAQALPARRSRGKTRTSRIACGRPLRWEAVRSSMPRSARSGAGCARRAPCEPPASPTVSSADGRTATS